MPIDVQEKSHREEERKIYRTYSLEKLFNFISTYIGLLFKCTEDYPPKNAYALERVKKALPLALEASQEKVGVGVIPPYAESCSNSFYVRIFPIVDDGQFTGVDAMVAIPSNSVTIYKAQITYGGIITRQEELGKYDNLEEAVKMISRQNKIYIPSNRAA